MGPQSRIRAGIESIPRGQIEGAQSVGMSYPQRMRYVVLPQAFARVAPPLLGQTAVLIKDSSLVSFIGVFELFGAGLTVLTERLMPNEGFLTANMLDVECAKKLAVRLGLFPAKFV